MVAAKFFTVGSTLPEVDGPLTPDEYVALFLARSFRSADRPQSTARLSADQVAMARLILSEFAEAGYPTRIALGAVANSYAESRLNPTLMYREEATARVPNGSWSVGLFQLNDAPRAAGTGMSIASRKNPTTNAKRIIEEVQSRYDNVVLGTLTPSQAAWAFCYYVERPRDASAKADIRASMCRAMWPGLGDLPPSQLPALVGTVPAESRSWFDVW